MESCLLRTLHVQGDPFLLPPQAHADMAPRLQQGLAPPGEDSQGVLHITSRSPEELRIAPAASEESVGGI